MPAGSQSDAEVTVTLTDLGGAETSQRERELQNVPERFYERLLASLGEKRQARAVRRLCEQRLISAGGRQSIETEEIERQFKVSAELLGSLVNAGFLRADRRLGGTFYKLSHDSLVVAVLNVRRKRMARRRRLAMTGLAVLAALVLGLAIFVLAAEIESELADEADALLDHYSILLSTPQSEQRLETVRAGLSATLRLYGRFPRKWPDGDTRLSGLLAWALDDLAAREPSSASEAQRLREDVLASLRRRRPQPEPPGLQDPDWADIPGGTFMMGGPAGPRVTLSPFRMLQHEVTVAEYRRLVPDHPGQPDEPAVDVSWYEAYAYAAWLGGRLPTEAEWEYAAQADCRTDYCDREGNETVLGKVAWTEENSGIELHPIGQLESNPWGLVDMYGNAWEWVADSYGPYPSEPQNDPRGPPLSRSGVRMIRGGSYEDSAVWARAANRFVGFPRVRYANLGFRVAFPAAPEPSAQPEGPAGDPIRK